MKKEKQNHTEPEKIKSNNLTDEAMLKPTHSGSPSHTPLSDKRKAMLIKTGKRWRWGYDEKALKQSIKNILEKIEKLDTPDWKAKRDALDIIKQEVGEKLI